MTITIQGKALTLDSDVTLVRSGSASQGAAVRDAGRPLDGVRFDLSAAALGTYAVEVASPGDGTVTVPNAFTLEAPRVQDVRATLVGLGRFVAGRKQTISVVVENFGNIDAVGVPLVIEGFPVGTEITPKFPMTNTTGADTPIFAQEWRPQNSVYTRGASSVCRCWSRTSPAARSTSTTSRSTSRCPELRDQPHGRRLPRRHLGRRYDGPAGRRRPAEVPGDRRRVR